MISGHEEQFGETSLTLTLCTRHVATFPHIPTCRRRVGSGRFGSGRRTGERIILVDPTPIAWAKPPRQDAKSWNKAKEKEAREREEEKERGARREAGGEEEEEEEGGGERGPHRRKRGVLGCRRRVEFPGRAATCSTKCRELWRRHLQVLID